MIDKKDYPKGYEKWGEDDFSRMKSFCVACLKDIGLDRKRFIVTGNYCITCSGKSDRNRDNKVINVKPIIE